jgi:hypothetical protein
MPAHGEDRLSARFLGKILVGLESFTSVGVKPGEPPDLSGPRRTPVSIPSAWPQVLDFFGTPIVTEPSIAEPLPDLAPHAETARAINQPGEAAPTAAATCEPAEALTGAARQQHFRLRRQRDPLGEGHPCTWRALPIQVAAEISSAHGGS